MIRVLLDACVPHWVRNGLAEFATETAQFAKLDHLSNGALIAAIEGRYDVLVTLDRNLEFQQRLKGHVLSVVVVRPSGQDRAAYRDVLAGLPAMIRVARPGSVSILGTGVKPADHS